MTTVGLVSVDAGQKWIGGRYYLQHLVRCVAALPENERVAFAEVWWKEAPDDDPFAEVRPLLEPRRVVFPPSSTLARGARKLRRAISGTQDARDLFKGIDVFFPIAPAENTGVPIVFWMPDFQPWKLPELFPAEMLQWYESHYRGKGDAASVIVVSSDDGLRDLETFFPDLAGKARVLHFCAVPTDEWWRVDPATAASKYALPEKFLMVANQFSHHKNHGVVFEAVRIARDRGVNLTLACTGSTWGFRGDDYFAGLQSFIAANDLGDSIRIAGLIALLRRAVAVVQPSRFEGWSTVVEDAKTLGKQILISDIPVHREQMPLRSRFLPLDDAAAWAGAMIDVWRDAQPGPELDEEAAALARLDEARLECGRTFVSIIREAAR
jgi:glycosyltransferase involved in cell wall biosynthesis